MRPVSCISPLVLLLALAGCHTEVHGGHNDAGMSLDGDTITLHRTGGPSAHVTRDGRFTVGAAPVTLSAQQQAEFVTLYNTAQQIKQHGIQTGKAGAAVGLAAAHEALDGIAKGDTSQIGAKVEAQADQVRVAAGRICEDLATLRQAQQSLAASLEAFRPYASVAQDDVTDCARDTQPKAGSAPAP